MIVEVDYSFSPEYGKMVCGVWDVLDDDGGDDDVLVVVGIVDRLVDVGVCQWAWWMQQQQPHHL